MLTILLISITLNILLALALYKLAKIAIKQFKEQLDLQKKMISVINQHVNP
jgi:hypothetical protein